MPRTDRLEAEISRGQEAFDEGDLEGAAKALERAERIDRKHPEVLMLGAAIAEEEGDAEGALSRLEQLMALTPADPAPRILAARVLLEIADDPKASLAMIAPAFDDIDDEDLLVDAVMTKTGALLALGDAASREQAKETIRELASEALDDPSVTMMLTSLAIDLEELDLAQRFLDRIVTSPSSDDPEEKALLADKLHLQGELYGQRGDKAAQATAWIEVRRLDQANDATADEPGFTPPEAEIAVAAEEIVDALPLKVRQHMLNVPILLDTAPSDDLIRDGVDPRSLGLFSGTPMSEPTPMPAPTAIHLFTRNIGRFSADNDEFIEQLEITIWHETAHFFGLEDDDLEQLGLG